MDWVPTALMLMAIVLLVVQGLVLLSKGRYKTVNSHHPHSHKQNFLAGALNVALALFAFAAFSLFASGALILSPEYGILLAQGRLAWLWTIATVTGIPVGIAAVLHVVRKASSLRSSQTWLIAGGLGTAAVTLLRVRVLNPDDHSAFQIRCSDLWSYFFLAWIVALLALWVLIVIHQKRSQLLWYQRSVGVAFALALCGLTATFHASVGFHFEDPWTLRLWRVTVWLVLPFVMSAVTWICFSKRQPQLGRGILASVSAVAGAAGVFSAYEWTAYVDGLQSWTTVSGAVTTCVAIWGAWAL